MSRVHGSVSASRVSWAAKPASKARLAHRGVGLLRAVDVQESAEPDEATAGLGVVTGSFTGCEDAPSRLTPRRRGGGELGGDVSGLDRGPHGRCDSAAMPFPLAPGHDRNSAELVQTGAVRFEPPCQAIGGYVNTSFMNLFRFSLLDASEAPVPPILGQGTTIPTERTHIMRRSIAAAGAAGLMVLAASFTSPAVAADNATVSVLHAVPGLTVDVYANGDELIPDFEPGTLTDPLSLPAGTYDLAVYADGDSPDTADPAIEAQGVEVPGGVNATIVANLDADGKPALNVFVNDMSATAAGEARLTVRHTAAAPAVDIRADGNVLFDGVTNPKEATADVAAGSYSADVVLAGTDTVAIGPADVALGEGANTIVYAWGSAADNNLKLAVQTIDGLHSAPAGVPGGELGLASESGAVPSWAIGLGVASLLALLLAGRQLVPARGRR